jgi:hypothetical protein
VWKSQYCGHEVAVKVLRTYLTSDFEQIRKVGCPQLFIHINKLIASAQRFCKEVVTWKSFHHPNVLSLLGVMTAENRFVMVSDWMVNGTITTFVEANAGVDRLALVCFCSGSLPSLVIDDHMITVAERRH